MILRLIFFSWLELHIQLYAKQIISYLNFYFSSFYLITWVEYYSNYFLFIISDLWGFEKIKSEYSIMSFLSGIKYYYILLNYDLDF